VSALWTRMFAASACLLVAMFSVHELRHSATRSLVVNAIAHEWWWEFDYPTLGVNVRDELHVPSGIDIHLQLISADVVHSLWIPGLRKAIPIIPGTSGSLDLLVESPGRFYGNCDTSCGCNAIGMRFPMIAESGVNFNNWIQSRRHDASSYNRRRAGSTSTSTVTRIPKSADSSSDPAKSFGQMLYSAHARHVTNASDQTPPNLTN
jgi:heme/copper-type cytochrome/quinol oxidase subunit 2